jgi:hypothetical protein
LPNRSGIVNHIAHVIAGFSVRVTDLLTCNLHLPLSATIPELKPRVVPVERFFVAQVQPAERSVNLIDAALHLADLPLPGFSAGQVTLHDL